MKKKLQIRVRAIPARFVIEQSPQKVSKKSLFEILRDWVGLIATAAGIFSVLLYLSGRSFAGGYFSAMNIPSYQVSFSLWEYGEVGWIPLLSYPIIMMLISGLLWGGLLGIRDKLGPFLTQIWKWILSFLVRLRKWTPKFITRFWSWLKQSVKNRLPSITLPPLSRETRLWFLIAKIAILILLLFSIVLLTLQFVHKWGENSGKNYVIDNSAQIELISTNLIPLDDTSNAINTNGIYIYKGFHLLTFNNGKYYLFKEIDKITCKPTKVYVIDATDNIHVNILPPVSLNDQCLKTANKISTPPQYP